MACSAQNGSIRLKIAWSDPKQLSPTQNGFTQLKNSLVSTQKRFGLNSKTARDPPEYHRGLTRHHAPPNALPPDHHVSSRATASHHSPLSEITENITEHADGSRSSTDLVSLCQKCADSAFAQSGPPWLGLLLQHAFLFFVFLRMEGLHRFIQSHKSK